MKRITALAVSLLLLLTACRSTPVPSVEADLAYLCSEELAGRLTGSPGNEKAQTYIMEQFKAAGLEFYNGAETYQIPYTQEIYDPAAQEQTLTAAFANGTEKTFRAGTDFYPWLYTAGGFSGPVTTNREDPEIASKVLLSDMGNAEALGSVIRSELATAHIDPMGGKPAGGVLKVPPAVFDALEGCVTLTLDGGLAVETATVNNIAGVLKGTESDDALLITAHVDHVGSAAGVYYPGAFDNASGTAALLETVRQMAASEERPAFDVVFAVFNGEEMGQPGSIAFIKAGFPYKTVNTVNLDCLGAAGVEGLLVSDSGGQISAQMTDYLTGAGFSCVQADYGLSDHQSFLSEGIPAVNLSSDMDGTDIKMHTPSDTPDGLEPDLIRTAAGAVKGYVLSAQLLGRDTLPVEKSVQEDFSEEDWKAVYIRGQELVEQLHPGRMEMVAFELLGEHFLVRDESPFPTMEALKAVYPDASIPLTLGEYRLDPTNRMFGGNGYELGLPDVSTVRAYSPELQALPLEQILPLSEESHLQSSVYYLPYTNPQGKTIHLSVWDSVEIPFDPDDSAGFRVETAERDGHTFYQNYQDMEDGKTYVNSVRYADPALPCYFTLHNEMTQFSAESWTLDMDTLTGLLSDTIPELEKMVPLP